jgi:hypothetical protein
MSGSLGEYWRQVWQLGFLYSGHTFVGNPVREGLTRTLSWLGFHAALAAGAAWFWWKGRDPDRWKFAAWSLAALVAVAAGWRFFPRYYFQLLPAMTLAAARGFWVLGTRRAVLLLLLLIPLARFGPRYAQLAQDLAVGHPHEWRDLAMNRDSREASEIILRTARPGDTLFVWGFRPDLFAYTRLPAGTRFLECQPLTGVFADRHLAQSASLEPEWTRLNRKELAATQPAFVVDGLSLFNPSLSMQNYEELRGWLAGYEEAGRTRHTIIYRRRITSPSSTARVSRETPTSPPARPPRANSSS